MKRKNVASELVEAMREAAAIAQGESAHATPRPSENPPMQLIAIEEHFLTPEVQAALAALPPEAQDAGQGLHSGEMKAQLEDLEDRWVPHVPLLAPVMQTR